MLREMRRLTETEPVAWHRDLSARILAATPWWIEPLGASFLPREDWSIERAAAEIVAARPDKTFFDELDLATLTLAAGDLEGAEGLFTRLAATGRSAYRMAWQPSDPRFYLGRIAALRGDRKTAVAQLELALERSPGDLFTLAELVALTDDSRHLEPLLAYTSTLDAQYLLGRALLVHGRWQEAAAAFGFVVRRLPEFRDGKIYLAAALGRSGLIDDGARIYLEAMQVRSDPVLESEAICDLFRRWAALHPDDAEVRLLAARALYQHGLFHEALALLDGLDPEAVPQVEQARREIQRSLDPQWTVRTR